MDVLVRSHSFEVTNFEPSYKKYLVDFCLKFTLYKVERDWRTGISSKTPDVTFASRFRDNSKFFFHLNTLPTFEKFLSERGIKYTKINCEMYEPVKVEYPGYKGVARDYQEGQIEYALDDGKSKLIGLQTGKGKAQPLQAIIKTPSGTTTMGELKVGSIISAWDGSDTTVTGIYPQGNKLTFCVTVESHGTALFCADHLWRVYLGDKENFIGPYYFNTTTLITMIYGTGNGSNATRVFINKYKDSKELVEITSIVKYGIYPCQCITIDHPDKLYVTDNDIVTHNTFCALTVVARMGVRTVIAMRAGFIHRWVPDLQAILGLKNTTRQKDFYVVQGSKSLAGLIDLAKSGELTAKVIIFSTDTLDAFFSHWTENNGCTGNYECTPFELFELIKPGLMLRDEIHLEFYKFFRQELFSVVPKILSLSATLIDKDPKVMEIYNTVYPPDTRAPEVTYDKYIAVTALSYDLIDPNSARFSHRGRREYNHGAYEKWISSNKERLRKYDQITVNWLASTHVKNCVKGQKSIIFCATIEYCTHLTKVLKQLYPEVDIRRYVGEDSTEALDADVIISTILSAGTALDIPGLRYSFMTVAINSHKANIQCLGRLRRLKEWPEITPEFYYLSCVDIRKHRDYLSEKIELFKPIVLSHGYVSLGVSI